jgi:outer membrane protein OmpA-like peptidoglycan-associated protein
MKLEISGHTDITGDKARNLKLSEELRKVWAFRRAAAILPPTPGTDRPGS